MTSVQVEQILRQRLLRDYEPGDRFSSEPRLCDEFQVSRTLIRSVLGALANEGLIRREPRRGTFVSKSRRGSVPPQLSDLIESLQAYRASVSVRVLDVTTEVGSFAASKHLGLSADDPVSVFRRLMSLDGLPVGYLISTVPHGIGSQLTREEIEHSPLSVLVPQRTGGALRQVNQTLEPIVADIEVARLLELPIGSPVLLVERDFIGRGARPVYHTQAYFRGEQYKFTVDLRLDQPPEKRATTRST